MSAGRGADATGAALPASTGRRRFIARGGALIVSFSLLPPLAAQEKREAQNAGKTPVQAPALPGSLEKSPLLDSWIRIGADNSVTVFTGKAELGQGIKTALIQCAAEELMVDFDRIKLVTADTALTANEGYTAGSHSMQDSGTAILNAAAQVRALLAGLAAQRFNVPAEQLALRNGTIATADGRKATYGELVANDVLHVRAQPQSPLRDPAQHQVIGKPIRRVDIPAKVTGGRAYVQDLRIDGMVHGRVVPPPSPGAKLLDVDLSHVQRMSGVLKIVRDGNFIAVIAQREWQAIAAMRALSRDAKWQEQAGLPAPNDMGRWLKSAPAQDYVILGNASAAPLQGAIEATYQRPYQLHASIGPSCAVAQSKDGVMTVWTHSQGVYPLRTALAQLLALPPERVHCIQVEGSGCYGHNGADDVAGDAALLARALPGRAVRVQWMREHEHAYEPFGPAMLATARAALDGNGNVTAWRYEVWSNTHSTRPGPAGNLLSARWLAQPFAPEEPKPLPQPEGGGDRNAIPLYRFPDATVVHHFIPGMPLRVSALRALGAYMNVFTIESFMDELARAARVDPVEFRLRHLDDPRAREVVSTAAQRFGWNDWKRQPGHGRGFAFARYKNLAAYAAVAMEVMVDRDSGHVQVLRAVATVDSGQAVNPDGIRNQIEGGIIQSMSWTLFEAVTFDDTRVTSRDWSSYPILRFSSVPETIEVHVIDRPGMPFLGTGEATQGPAAACIANAVADAIGRRIRELPLSPAKIKAAALA